jgi:hypothetical protein
MWAKLILVSLFAPTAWPCSCREWPSAKGAWETSPVVFLGPVERIETNTGLLGSILNHLHPAGGRLDGPQTIRVRVDEPFKGVQAASELWLDQPGHSCAPKFRTGEKALFYLHPGETPGSWEASGCHRTRDLESAADDLLFLRALPSAATRSRLSGEVFLYPHPATNPLRPRPALRGLPVRIRGAGKTIHTVTNADGVYEVYDLPEGSYRVEPDLPPGLIIDFPLFAGGGPMRFASPDSPIALPARGGASVSFALREGNQVSGRVVDPAGRPLAGVPITLEPEQGATTLSSGLETKSREDGVFRLITVPAGAYRLVANRPGIASGRVPFGAVYLPGTTQRNHARVFRVGTRDRVENVTLRVPRLQPTITVTGRAQLADGEPAPNAALSLLSGNRQESLPERSDSDGRFRVRLLAGRSVHLLAEWTPNHPSFRQDCRASVPPRLPKLRSAPAPIRATSHQTDVLLTLPASRCAPQIIRLPGPTPVSP